ncbi:MAG: RNA polymerase sigma factor RpoD/SigA [bacterium]
MRKLSISKSRIICEAPSLDKYLSDIQKAGFVSMDEEILLAKRIKLGDQAALEKLCKANLRFVVSVAIQYQRQGLSLPDLISEGNLGLIKAAKRFDETRGFKFISYGVWWIRQSILQALAEQSRIVRLPLNKLASMNKMNKAIAQLEQHYQRCPTSEEISLCLKIPEKEFKGLIRNSITTKSVSIDAPSSFEGAFIFETLSDEDGSTFCYSLDYQSLKIEIQRVFSSLDRQEVDVLSCYYGLNGNFEMNNEEIAELFNLEKGEVQRIRVKGLRRLKLSSRSDKLKKYYYS